MGFFDGWDGGSVVSHKTTHRTRKSASNKSSSSKSKKSRSHSRERHRHSTSTFDGLLGGGSPRTRAAREVPSLAWGTAAQRASSAALGVSRSSSYYKRQPRNNFVQRMYKKLKRLLRDLVYYAKRHPMKVFMLVIMPLITGGALTALLARFGLKLPPGIERMLGIAAKTASGDSFGLMGEAVRMAGGMGGGSSSSSRNVHVDRGYEGDMRWERTTYQDDGWGQGWGGDSWGGGLVSGFSKMFA
ncbi:hypothetical protein PG993_000461 [Apiospora rasikravindrae]|uniref:Uncharacterized protein n=1 Tax=Apiospora rasikravindrae TaxID=990691 RepID=A0ABR1UBG5_9PEZI